MGECLWVQAPRIEMKMFVCTVCSGELSSGWQHGCDGDGNCPLPQEKHSSVSFCVDGDGSKFIQNTKPCNSRIGYDPPGHPTDRGYSLTVIEGEGGEDHAPLTIFYHDRCRHQKYSFISHSKIFGFIQDISKQAKSTTWTKKITENLSQPLPDAPSS